MKKIWRIFLHIDDHDESWAATPSFRPVQIGSSNDCVWYELYDAVLADKCLAAAASARTRTKARSKAEKIDNVRSGLGRAIRKSEFDTGQPLDWWWEYGSLVHLVFPDGRGVPDGYYARHNPSVWGLQRLTAARVKDMTRLTLDQMTAGDLFQLAELAHTG